MYERCECHTGDWLDGCPACKAKREPIQPQYVQTGVGLNLEHERWLSRGSCECHTGDWWAGCPSCKAKRNLRAQGW